jgi:hypothetical protein
VFLMSTNGSLIALALSFVMAGPGEASMQPPRRGDRDRDATIARLEREVAQLKRELQQLQRRIPRVAARPGMPGFPGARFGDRNLPRMPEVRQGFRGELRGRDPRGVPGRPAPSGVPEVRSRLRDSGRVELQRGVKPEPKPGVKFEFKHAKPGVKADAKPGVKAGAAAEGKKPTARPGDRPGVRPGERTPPPVRKRRIIAEN